MSADAHRQAGGGRNLGLYRPFKQCGTGQLSGFSVLAAGPRARGEGERLLVAPRVLVDATAVPADRGALGRYVDGLVAALGATGADLAVACQRNDEERYGRLVPEATVVAGPTAIAHRAARLA